jgi:hypothetical protein
LVGWLPNRGQLRRSPLVKGPHDAILVKKKQNRIHHLGIKFGSSASFEEKKSPSGMCSAQYATGMSPVSSCIPEALAVQAGNTTEPVVGKFFKKEIGGESFQWIEKPLQ